ncbi:MAG TPA: glycosyltransferase family A protein [Candidatus Methylomirabilis sp.]|nr:glycosyltransferase family A protein [Candidatus Methylomirabilis sp.]
MDFPVSVIIPAYNRARLIPQTIDSIIEQSLHPAEIIVVDDGSTDDTETAIKRYGDKVRYIKIENSGVCKARNVGVSASNCDWIAFCDSDDLWDREKLLRQTELVRYAPEVEYCFTNFKTVSNGIWSQNVKFDDAPKGYWDIPKVKITPFSFVISEPFYPNLLRFQPIFPSTIMMTKKYFHRVGGFDESFGRKLTEDFEFTLRCSQESPIGVVTEPVVGIRRHEQNFSKGRISGISFIISDIDILEYSLKNHRLGNLYESVINKQIIGRSIAVANGAFSHGEFKIVRDMSGNIPMIDRSLKMWVKLLVARLPSHMAKHVQNLLIKAANDP